MLLEQRARIRVLNNQLRQGRLGGRIMITPGVTALGEAAVAQAFAAMAAFSDFSPGNDPYEEHDFGAFHLGEQQLFWKIDYYAPGFENASLDPADETRCVRVLTLMLAEEY